MDKRIVIVIAALLVVAAGVGAFAVVNNGNDDKENNYTIAEAGFTLTGGTYDNVIIAASVGDGDVTLKNVKILKNLIVRGGGSHSVNVEECEVDGKVSVEKEGGEDVRINANGSNITQLSATSNVILDSEGDGGFRFVDAKDCNVTVNEDASVQTLSTKGESTITVNGDVGALATDGKSDITVGYNGSVSNVESSGETSMNVAGKVRSMNSSGTTTIEGNGSVDSASVSGDVTVDSKTVGTVTVTGESEVTVNGDGNVAIDVKTGDSVSVKSESADVDIGTSNGSSANVTVNDTPVEHVHQYEKHEGKQATCEEAGYSSYVTCSCGYSSKEEIPALGHKWR